jgi:hypothetical protein
MREFRLLKLQTGCRFGAKTANLKAIAFVTGDNGERQADRRLALLLQWHGGGQSLLAGSSSNTVLKGTTC